MPAEEGPPGHHLATHAIHLAGNGTDATGQWYMWGTHSIGGEAMFLALTWDMHCLASRPTNQPGRHNARSGHAR